MALITCNHLSLGYDGVEIVHDLNFNVNEGDYLCVVGENGSGKSTLMKTLLGLQVPMAGEIRTCDGFSQSEIGYLPQMSPVQRDFPATAWEIVLSGCQGRAGARPFYRACDRARARDAMERMGVSSLASRSYRTLSGGQQQRVLLARALAATTKMLLLDEPVAGLDPLACAEMYRQIASLHEEGITVVMISHDIGGTLPFADHILHIGDTVFFGTKEEYLATGLGRDFTGGGDAR